MRKPLLAPALFVLLSSAPTTLWGQTYSDAYPKNPDVDVIGYVFRVALSDDTDEIRGTTTIETRFNAGGVTQLRLDLIQQADSLDGKGMTVTSVESDGTPLSYRYESNALHIDLPRSVRSGDRIRVNVSYRGEPASGLKIGPNRYGDRTFFSDNWSSRARNWLPLVDHPYDKATTEMIVTAPSHYQVASNGVIVEQTDIGDGNRLTHYVNDVPTATWLYFIGVARFAVQVVDHWNDVPVETWVYTQDRDAGFYDFAEPSKKVLGYYEDLIGPYVYGRLANVVSTATGGGMEAASTPAYSERSVSGTRNRRWQHVIIHEIAHQWFGNAVTEFHWNDVWLSEGFATYYTLLFRRHLYGHDDFIAGLEQSRNTVVRFYDETDYDFQIVRDFIPDLNNVSGAMMYQKGAWVLHMLRERLGHDTYDAGIRTYYTEFLNANAQTADLRRHLEAASGTDLTGFFDEWLFQGGIPQLEGSWSANGGTVEVSLRQIQPRYTFAFPVEFRVELADGTSELITLQVTDRQPVQSQSRFGQDVVDVVIDPNTRLLAKWTFGPRN